MTTRRVTTLTDGCAAAWRALAGRSPDGLLLAGLSCFGVGVYEFDPRAVWLYAGGVLVWLAFGVGVTQRAGGPQA